MFDAGKKPLNLKKKQFTPTLRSTWKTFLIYDVFQKQETFMVCLEITFMCLSGVCRGKI